MPTTCSLTHRCAPEITSWLNGVHTVVTDGQVIRQVGFHWYTLYCNFSLNFQVRNCGSYYVACNGGGLRFWWQRWVFSPPPKSQTASNAGYIIRATVSYLEVEGEVTIVSRPVKADLPTAAQNSCLLFWSKAPTQFYGKSYNFRFIVSGKGDYWKGNLAEKHSSLIN